MSTLFLASFWRARTTMRPMRPKPLMPMRTMDGPPRRSRAGRRSYKTSIGGLRGGNGRGGRACLAALLVHLGGDETDQLGGQRHDLARVVTVALQLAEDGLGDDLDRLVPLRAR